MSSQLFQQSSCFLMDAASFYVRFPFVHVINLPLILVCLYSRVHFNNNIQALQHIACMHTLIEISTTTNSVTNKVTASSLHFIMIKALQGVILLTAIERWRRYLEIGRLRSRGN